MAGPTYATVDELRGWASEVAESRMVKAARLDSSKNTFLSHSSQDNDLLAGVVAVLEGHGASVYVDVGDTRLPDPPSTNTAEILRNTIAHIRRFVLLVSEASKGSAWVPWELGLADGQKGLSSVALFPAVQNIATTRWTEREYLGLYSRIVWGEMVGRTTSLWMVYDHHNNSAMPLSEWLSE